MLLWMTVWLDLVHALSLQCNRGLLLKQILTYMCMSVMSRDPGTVSYLCRSQSTLLHRALFSANTSSFRQLCRYLKLAVHSRSVFHVFFGCLFLWHCSVHHSTCLASAYVQTSSSVVLVWLWRHHLSVCVQARSMFCQSAGSVFVSWFTSTCVNVQTLALALEVQVFMRVSKPDPCSASQLVQCLSAGSQALVLMCKH